MKSQSPDASGSEIKFAVTAEKQLMMNPVQATGI
jgi:hypothetical protein